MARNSRLAANLATVTTLALGGALVIDGQATVGVVAAATLLAGRAVQSGQSAAQGWANAHRAAMTAGEILPLFQGGAAVEPVSASLDGAPAPSLRFRSSAAPYAPGSVLVVAGGAGALRRRFLETVAGLRPPTGAVGAEFEVDGQAPEAYRAAHSGAVTFQLRTPRPFEGTILDNLTVYQRGASDAAAYAASERVRLNAEVQRLPAGYLTRLGGAGADPLSTAAHVKLSLARVIALEARLLVLDDPTAWFSPAEAAAVAGELKLLADAGRATLVVGSDDPLWRRLAADVITLSVPEAAAPATSGPMTKLAQAVRVTRTLRRRDAVVFTPHEHCLAALLEATGWDGTAERLVDVMPHVDPIDRLDTLAITLKRLGFACNVATQRADLLTANDFPAVYEVDGRPCVAETLAAFRQQSAARPRARPSVRMLSIASTGRDAYIRPERPATFVARALDLVRDQMIGAVALTAAIYGFALVVPIYAISVYNLALPADALSSIVFFALIALAALTAEDRLRRIRDQLLSNIGVRLHVHLMKEGLRGRCTFR